ncbi:MAG: endonuclease/exonuclease/phosphatase family protein, partial [Melioribacteraceae bacterium]|nr:endonuclease/exonuclease/phosphatase family protein [Melioribacteraceae bacterium]
DRRGTVYVNNSEYTIGVGALFLIISPTVWSDKFEITMNLNSSVGGKDLFSSERIRLLIKDESTGVSIPSEDRGSGYRIGDYSFTPLQGYSMVKQSDEFIRVMAHNVLFSNFMKPEATGAYQRLYRAVQPDIIGFSELYTDYSIDEIITRLEEILPSPEGKSWKVERTNDNVLATRYSIKFSTSAGPFGNGAFLIDLRPTYNSDLFIVVAHPPCCDNDPARQDEADAIAAFIRDAKAPGGELTLTDKTPVMIVGDMNFVGDPRQVSALVDGDIVQENIYGNDYIPDWDGTSFEDSKPLSSNLPHTFTHNGGDGPGTYSNGRLDYIIYSGSVLDLENSFVMFTPAMPQDTLTLYGLIDSDTDIASDHLPLIADFKLTYEQNETVLYGIRQNDENGIPVMIDQVATVDGIV